MPTKSTWFRKQNYDYLIDKVGLDGFSEYVNKLIEEDSGTIVSKKVIRKERAIEARAETKNKVSSLKGTGKGDGEHTCKTCGYMLYSYKGKCPNKCK
jgi:rubrerythrin